MNNKVNNSIDNSMVRAYGEDFNLKTEEIIDIIEKIYKLEFVDTNFNPRDVEVALFNYDYYVRPGTTKDEFMVEFNKVFIEAKNNWSEKGNNILTNHIMLMKTIGVIKRFFDEAYFKEQIKRRRISTTSVNKRKLEMYLKKFDKKQIEAFMRTVIIHRCQHGLFISETSAAAFWQGIHESCREVGLNVPVDFDSAEGQLFMQQNPLYYFRVLSAKTIAKLLCRAIDLDVALATSTAKKLYNFGYDAMLNYLRHKLASRECI